MQKIAFILASTDQGCLIINRLDYAVSNNGYFGVGSQVLETGTYETIEGDFYCTLLDLKKHHNGEGVVALDCGANIGLHTVRLAKHLFNWGKVIAIEAQERIFYALAGNIAIGNHSNARAIHAVIGTEIGTAQIPLPDYNKAGSYGSLELRQSKNNEYIGQYVDYRQEALVEVKAITIDSLRLDRLDFIKIDVEGMEIDVLEGGRETIRRLRPIIAIENLKVGTERVVHALRNLGYENPYSSGIMTIALHPDDPVAEYVTFEDKTLS